MGGVNETITNVNAAMRNLLLMVLVGGAGYGGYKAYDLYNEPNKLLADKEKQLADKQTELDSALTDLTARRKEVAELTTHNKELSAENERLELRLKLLAVQHRLARLKVIEQKMVPPPEATSPAPGTGPSTTRPTLMTKIEFVEINDAHEPIGQPKQFDIKGDMVYIDYLTVNFEDKYIEQSDLDRSTSIALFQRIFGEHQEPVQGFQLDTVGTRPNAYSRGTKMSDFEKKIWNEFWLIANDRPRAVELGINALQGEAVSMRVKPGMTYDVRLRSTGPLTIVPVETPAAGSEPKGTEPLRSEPNDPEATGSKLKGSEPTAPAETSK